MKRINKNYLYIIPLLFLCFAEIINAENNLAAFKEIRLTNQKTLIDKTAAAVNGQIISLSELKEKMMQNRLKDSLDIFNYPDSVLKENLEMLIDEKLLLQAAQKEEIKISAEKVEAEVKDLLKNIKKIYPDDEKLKQSLEKDGLDIYKLENILTERISNTAKIQTFIANKIAISDKEIEEFKIRASKENNPLNSYVLSHILIRTGSGNMSHQIEKEGEALRILYQCKRPDADFSEIAKEYSEDETTKNTGGNLGILNEGEIMPEIEKRLAKMEVGEIAGPVKTKIGYHIIYLKDHITPRDKLFSEKYNEVYKNTVKKLRADADINILLN